MEQSLIRLLILDALADNWESFESMRDCGEDRPSGLAVLDEARMADALRSLLDDGLVEAAECDAGASNLVSVPAVRTDDAHLRRYWYRPTRAGDAIWRAGDAALDAYWDGERGS